MKRTWSLSWPKKAKAEPTTSVDESTKDGQDSSTVSETPQSDQVEKRVTTEDTAQDKNQLVLASDTSGDGNTEPAVSPESLKDGDTVARDAAPDSKVSRSEGITPPSTSTARDKATIETTEPEKHDVTATGITKTEPSPDSKPKQLSIKKLKEYPLSDRQLSLPESTKEGQIQVAAGRGKPFWLSYKAYGTGPIRIVWLCGHGDTIKAWRRMVTHFGHENSDK